MHGQERHEQDEPQEIRCVFNVTREAFLNLGTRVADTAWTRLRGLVGRMQLASDEGLWLVPAQGTHTMGVLFPIDVVYLDAQSRVLHVIENLNPFRIAPFKRHARSILLLPVRTIFCSDTQVGDRLMISTLSEWRAYWDAQASVGSLPTAAARIAVNGKAGHASKEPARSPRRNSERRRAQRRAVESLAAYFWDGDVPKGHRILDISPEGAFIQTESQFYPGTIMEMTLRFDARAGGQPAAFLVRSRAVRQAPNGIGVQFVHEGREELQACSRFLDLAGVRQVLPRPPNGRSGQSLIEFSLILPLLFLLIVNVVNFGAFFFSWITIANAARSGAQYLVMASAAVGAPQSPSAAQVTAIVAKDISSLLNRASLQVKVCTNNNGTVACTGSGGGAPPGDPEPANYVLASVDVTYTYRPPIPLWNFASLGIRATLPPTTIHRRAVMRMIQ